VLPPVPPPASDRGVELTEIHFGIR